MSERHTLIQLFYVVTLQSNNTVSKSDTPIHNVVSEHDTLIHNVVFERDTLIHNSDCNVKLRSINIVNVAFIITTFFSALTIFNQVFFIQRITSSEIYSILYSLP